MMEKNPMNNKIVGFEYSKIFVDDVKITLDYIEYVLENPIAAKKLGEEIINSIKNKMGTYFFSKKYQVLEKDFIYYRIYIKNYILFYTIDNNIIKFRRFLYNRRDFDKIDVIS